MAIGMGLSIQNSSGGRRYEPKRAFRWMLEVNPPADIGIGEVIKTTCFSFGRPSITFEKTTIHRLNSSYHVRGKGEWEDVELILNDGGDSGSNAAKAMYTWQQAIRDEATDIMLPEDAVKAIASLKLLNGAGETIEEWLGDGFAPISISYNSVALDMSSSDVLQVSCNFSCDKWLLVSAV